MSTRDLYANPLKTVPVEKLEEAIAKTILELTGYEWTADIRDLNFDSGRPMSWADVYAKMTITLEKVRDSGFEAAVENLESKKKPSA